MRRDYFNIAELFKSHCCSCQSIPALGPALSLRSERKKSNFSSPPFPTPAAKFELSLCCSYR